MDNPAFVPDSDVKAKVSDEKEQAGLVLARKVGYVRGTAFVVGIIIGTGIFISPGRVLAQTGSVGLCLIVWTASGLLSSLGALAYAELAILIPKSGGDYSYFLKCFGKMHPFWGPLPAFLHVWITTLFTRATSQAIAFTSFASYVITPFIQAFHICGDSPNVAFATKLGALVCLGLVAFINCYSVTVAAKVQVVFTIAKVAAILIIIVGGFYEIGLGSIENFTDAMKDTTDSPGNIAKAFYSCLYAYTGWANITMITEEVRNPAKNLPRSILSGIAIVTLCYVLVNIAFLAVLTPKEMVTSKAVATDWGKYVLGKASVVIPFFVAMSIFGSQNGASFTGSRLCFAAGREGHFPKILSYIDIDRNTPKPAVLFSSFLGCIMILLGNVSSLINIFSFTSWIFNAVAMVVLLIMKRRADKLKVLYQVPVIIPVFVFLMAIFLVVMPIVTNPGVEFLYTILAFFVGFLYYVVFVYYRKSLPFLDSLGGVLEKVLNVGPPKSTDD